MAGIFGTQGMAAVLPLGLMLLAFGAPWASGAEQCTSSSQSALFDYTDVFKPMSDAELKGLPGFTRSVYADDHALVTPESRVWATNPNGWKNSLTAYIITPTPSKGAHFTMYLADMKKDSQAGPTVAAVERKILIGFIFVVEGSVVVSGDNRNLTLEANHWAYFPPTVESRISSKKGAGLVVFERLYAKPEGNAKFLHGYTEDSPVLPADPEVFVLRKLLPATDDYDFNVHIMDFQPGEYLYVKEVHYNQHGLLLLQGQGIYRLGNSWFPVQAGDAIWMGPYVPQWYGALGKRPSRYILYKDTSVDPLISP